uniref:Uncharacterized protein n=1 Tax=Zea mays TaxID=4577 RepID=A0A804NRB1_MAIZE
MALGPYCISRSAPPAPRLPALDSFLSASPLTAPGRLSPCALALARFRSPFSPLYAFVVLWSQPDPSVHSLFVHRASRVLAFVIELLNPSSLSRDFVVA